MLRSIELINIGPFTHWRADSVSPQAIVAGNNGDGKSTIREVLACMLDDHNTKLIRNGSEEGEIRLEFEVRWNAETGEIAEGGGEAGIVRTQQRIRAGGSKYDIELPSGLKVLRSQKEFLRGLVTGCSLDPLKLVEGSDKDRIEFLLSVCPVWVGREEVGAIVGDGVPLLDTYNLEMFENLIEQMEVRRTEQNGAVRASKGLLQKLEASLSATAPEGDGWSERVKSLRVSLLDAIKAEAECREVLRSDFEESRRGINSAQADTLARLNAREQEEVEEIRLRFRTLREESQRLGKAQGEELKENLESKLRIQVGPLEEQVQTLKVDLARAEERAAQHVRAETQRAQVNDTREALRAESLEATRRQKVVDRLRDLRASKLSTIGIDGVEIRSGVLYVDGKEYGTQLNEAERIKVAVQIAAKGLERMPVKLMVIDAGDSLSEENLDWVMQGAKSLGIQVLMTKRSTRGGGLKIVPYEKAAQLVA